MEGVEENVLNIYEYEMAIIKAEIRSLKNSYELEILYLRFVNDK